MYEATRVDVGVPFGSLVWSLRPFRTTPSPLIQGEIWGVAWEDPPACNSGILGGGGST